MADFRVRLANSTVPSEVVVFNVTPDVIETRNVNYKAIDPIHAPGQMMSYQNTSSRSFNISQIRLVSRTEQEAAENLRRIWTLKGWTMPYFGASTLSQTNRDTREALNNGGITNPLIRNLAKNYTGAEMRGAPPAVLLLSAYSDDTKADTGDYLKHISRVPCVLQSLSIPYPSDCDYIPAAGSGVPMPTIMMIDMTLTETQSPASYTNFNLASYKLGKLGGF